MLLFFGFISTLFTASPFEPFNHPSGSGGSGGGEGGGLGAWAKWRGSYVNVPRDSHAYLQAAFPGAGPESFTHNVSRLWDAAAAQVRRAYWLGGYAAAGGSLPAAAGGCARGCAVGHPAPLAQPLSSPALPSPPLQLAGQASYFGPWIAQDLQPWAKTGITKARLPLGCRVLGLQPPLCSDSAARLRPCACNPLAGSAQSD